MEKMKNEAWFSIVNNLKNHEVKKGIHSFVNPFSMLMLESESNVAKSIDFWYVDGISLVNNLNRDFSKSLKRFSFDETSLAPVVFSWAKNNSKSIAIIGTRAEFIEDAVDAVRERFDVEILYFRNGYFLTELEREETYNRIKEQDIDLVICGMGTPYQEKFLIGLKNAGWDGVAYTCGGFLHQIAKKRMDYYPRIFDKFNIRWIYRIIDEPKLIRRYFYLYPVFFLKFKRFKQRLKRDD